MKNNIQKLSNEQLLLARIFNTFTANEVATEQRRRAESRPPITPTIAKRAMAYLLQPLSNEVAA
jgi:hypothetical protein